MSKAFKEGALWILVLALLSSLLQTEKLFYHIQTNTHFRIYFWVSIAVITISALLLIRIFTRKKSFLPTIIQKFTSLSIPRGARILILVVLFGNLLAIALGKAWYPFYDVGMFRWSTPFHNNDKVLHQLKYYYWKNGECKILDLRKEGSFWFAENFGLGYTEEFMFSACFRNKEEKKNFEFLNQLMKDRGVDTLWVGVHTVNFETRDIDFDPDICNAVTINETAKQYYGPIYIPEYQRIRCHTQ